MSLQVFNNCRLEAAPRNCPRTRKKEAIYYGPSVAAADANKVLLRWKLDDGQYRVIFGDLRIDDISAVRLAELEAK